LRGRSSARSDPAPDPSLARDLKGSMWAGVARSVLGTSQGTRLDRQGADLERGNKLSSGAKDRIVDTKSKRRQETLRIEAAGEKRTCPHFFVEGPGAWVAVRGVKRRTLYKPHSLREDDDFFLSTNNKAADRGDTQLRASRKQPRHQTGSGVTTRKNGT